MLHDVLSILFPYSGPLKIALCLLQVAPHIWSFVAERLRVKRAEPEAAELAIWEALMKRCLGRPWLFLLGPDSARSNSEVMLFHVAENELHTLANKSNKQLLWYHFFWKMEAPARKHWPNTQQSQVKGNTTRGREAVGALALCQY